MSCVARIKLYYPGSNFITRRHSVNETDLERQISLYCVDEWENEETPGNPAEMSSEDIIQTYFDHQSNRDGGEWLQRDTLTVDLPD